MKGGFFEWQTAGRDVFTAEGQLSRDGDGAVPAAAKQES